MYARTTSKLSQDEVQLEESPNGHVLLEPTRTSLASHDLSLASMSDVGSDDKVSCAESWASSLISELEHFKNGKHNRTPSRKTEADTAIGTMDKESASSESKGREIVPVSGSHYLGANPCFTRNPDEIIEDIRVAMAHINHLNTGDFFDARKSADHPDGSILSPPSGYISPKTPNVSSVMGSSDRVTGVDNSSSETSNQKLQSDLSKSICKMVELIEGISLPSLDYDTEETFSRKDGSFFPHKNSETPTGYVVRVFQWKTSELRSVLNQFVHSCDDLLNGKADLEKFARELTSALDWIMNHCFSLQDVSSMKDAIKKQFDWDESRSENEVEIGTKLNEALQKLSSLEVELESRNNCCEDLEATCLELQLQLDRITKKETPNHDMDQEENQLRTVRLEITAASEKLAECQETILNLGKQLKALASPIEASLVDNVISTPSDTITTTATVTTTSIATNKNMSQRSSLLDRMLAEDDAETKDPKSPKTKESNRTLDPQKSPTRLHANTKPTFSPNGTLELPKKFVSLNGIKSDADDTAVGSLAILPSKKRSSGVC
ncbi:Filament-like plant protein 7 [Vitis vinifera]|uniref:Filament-like plant protein 7 n=1 Tax=Vitis vinifera TaxID=29760 RepID=A0A438KIN8_VITVI|nr:Filament-like plant protein 7 [Vitis vinifera]